ncbi:MAG: hypothetical protein KBS60_04155 [Phascolarctobacterium sp.]|nr:hypothetical protein [Candidatus Phascolarctobacterium caballi]
MITNLNMVRSAQLINEEENAKDAMFGVLWTLGKAHVENGAWVLDDEEIESLYETENGFTFDGYDFFSSKIEAVEDGMWQIACALGFASKANGVWARG